MKVMRISKKRAERLAKSGGMIRGAPLKLNSVVASKLAKKLENEFLEMHKDFKKNINSLFSSSDVKKTLEFKTVEAISLDASPAVKARHLLNKLVRKWEKNFSLFGREFSNQIVNVASNQSKKDLKRSAEKMTGGLTVKMDSLSQRTKDIITASTDQCSSLIKTMALGYSSSVKEMVFRSIATNNGSLKDLQKGIHDTLQAKYKTYKNKAKNTALDQTRKAYSNIAVSKMQDIGINEYIWRHSGGRQSPRHYHKFVLNGKTFKLSDPPIINQKTGERGKPGDDYNCGCYMEPVINFD